MARATKEKQMRNCLHTHRWLVYTDFNEVTTGTYACWTI
jgi:hypothetical protein